MLHELWEDPDGGQDPDGGGYLSFDLAGPRGDASRATLSPTARLVWTVEADSHFEAMTRYWAHMGWGVYTTDFPDQDCRSYCDLGWE